MDRNIVRAIVKGDSDDYIVFIKAKRLVIENEKVIFFNDKFKTTTTDLFYIRKVTIIEQDVSIFLEEISFNNSYIFANDQLINY